MSKTYDALTKAMRDHATPEGKRTRLLPVSESELSELSSEATLGKTELGTEPGAVSKEPVRPRPAVHQRRITNRVSVGNLTVRPDSAMAEQFRKIKSVITLHNLARSLHSVLITSCLPGEGKTTVAFNLSVVIAKGLDDSVILVDGDLRRRSLTSLLKLEKAQGLSDLLEDRVRIDETITETEIPGLTILPSGTIPLNPGELVGSTRMKDLIQQLREEHSRSYILIDSPPLASTSETNVLSQVVDGVIVVIMADKTRRDLVKREVNNISHERLLGVVLNGANFETSHYHERYYKPYFEKEND